jgi:hypothetical protein
MWQADQTPGASGEATAAKPPTSETDQDGQQTQIRRIARDNTEELKALLTYLEALATSLEAKGPGGESTKRRATVVAADVPKATKFLESAQKLSPETISSYRRDLANFVKDLVDLLNKHVRVWESFTRIVDGNEMLNGQSTGVTEKSRQEIQISLVGEIPGAERHHEGLVQLVGVLKREWEKLSKCYFVEETGKLDHVRGSEG